MHGLTRHFTLSNMPVAPTPVRVAHTDDEIRRCHDVMVQLRPHVAAAEFLPRVRQQQSQGFELAFLEDQGLVRSVAGYRVMEMLYSGRTLYVDDLVTDESSRSKGYGDRMFDWLVQRARALGCQTFSLDSGTQRIDAHRFYLRKRMAISSFHFQLRLD